MPRNVGPIELRKPMAAGGAVRCRHSPHGWGPSSTPCFPSPQCTPELQPLPESTGGSHLHVALPFTQLCACRVIACSVWRAKLWLRLLRTAQPCSALPCMSPLLQQTEGTPHHLQIAITHVPNPAVQVVRWESSSTQTSQNSHKRMRSSACADASNTHAGSRRQLVITLPEEHQVPAAMAVLAALYGVKPVPELLSELTQEQQLHAALVADMWQIDAVSTNAAQLLERAAQSLDGLSAAASKQLLSMTAYPDCLEALVQVVLLDKLGDVEAVWGDAELQELLLGLPLAAMELLPASDELKVRLDLYCIAVDRVTCNLCGRPFSAVWTLAMAYSSKVQALQIND